jgi:hypothetical protein
MIRNKITTQIKDRFIKEIEEATKTGKERGFLLCKNDNKLSATKSSVENENFINLKELKSSCPIDIQGDFHVHVHVGDAKKFIGNFIPHEDINENEIKDLLIKTYKDKGLSISSPSYGDLLGTLILKKKKQIIGTTCVSSDAKPKRVECWTAKDKINDKDYKIAENDIVNLNIINDYPNKWITGLFNREIIDLDK